MFHRAVVVGRIIASIVILGAIALAGQAGQRWW